MLKNVRYHGLRDFRSDPTGLVDALRRDAMSEEYKRDYFAFTCLRLSPLGGELYCGVTNFGGDILHAFDLKKKAFRSLGFPSLGDPYAIKIHRALEVGRDGTVYGATACLHDESFRLQAPGGMVFRFTPGEDRIEKLVTPCPPEYIQTITLDDERGIVYGFTYPVFKFFVYRLATGEVEDHDYIGSITHISAVDDAGRFWGTWHHRQHNLFWYDPEERRIHWTRNRLPGAEKDAGRMYPGAGPVDVMINGGDGYIYVGSVGGRLYRLNPDTAEAEYLGQPSPAERMPGLAVWRDGLLLGVSGDNETTNVFVYDREKHSFRNLGPIVAEDGLPIFRVHDLAVVGENTLYIAETDVPGRSGYLWEAEVDF